MSLLRKKQRDVKRIGFADTFMGISFRYGKAPKNPSSYSNFCKNTGKKASEISSKMVPYKKLTNENGSLASRLLDHVKMGKKISETLKGKLRLGARIIKEGSMVNVFKQTFSLSQGEVLRKSFQCYLSTTAGPIAGLLFISNQNVAFCSENSITVYSPSGKSLTTFYKVLIPIRKIKGAYESLNVKNPSQKYMEIVTKDGFEFWFMGFIQYEKAFDSLEKALSSIGTHLTADCKRKRDVF